MIILGTYIKPFRNHAKWTVAKIKIVATKLNYMIDLGVVGQVAVADVLPHKLLPLRFYL